MPLDVQTLFEVLAKLADEKQMRVTVSEAAKSGVIAGAGVFAGALLGGPPGILIGRVHFFIFENLLERRENIYEFA